MSTDTYQTISKPSSGEFKERSSKFISFAYPVKTEEEAKEILKQLKKEYFDASHHCWALVLGAGKEFQKSNDDREPNNTAGKPILRSVLSKDLTDVLVVVIRYFGGKLLGVPGLINAYGTATTDALNKATIEKKFVMECYKVICDYALHNELYRIGKTYGLKLINNATADENCFTFEIRKSLADELLKKLHETGIRQTKFLNTL